MAVSHDMQISFQSARENTVNATDELWQCTDSDRYQYTWLGNQVTGFGLYGQFGNGLKGVLNCLNITGAIVIACLCLTVAENEVGLFYNAPEPTRGPQHKDMIHSTV